MVEKSINIGTENTRAVALTNKIDTESRGFSDDEVHILPQLLAPVKGADWSTDVLVDTSFATSVSSNLEDSEERISLQENPYRGVTVRLSGLSMEEHQQVLQILAANAESIHPFPLYSDQSNPTSDVETTDTTIFIDTSGKRFFAHRRVIGINPKTNQAGMALIAEVLPDRLILQTSLNTPLDSDSVVMPLIDCEIGLSNTKDNITGDKVTLVITFPEVEGPSTLPCTPKNYFNGDSFNGVPIFRGIANWNKAQKTSLSRRGEAVSVGKASFIAEDGSRALFQFDMNATEFTRASAWYNIQFFESRRGRAFPFWMAAPEDIFEFNSAAGAIIQNEGFVTGDVALFDKYIKAVYLEYEDGTTEFYEVANITNGNTKTLIKLKTSYSDYDQTSNVSRFTFAIKAVFTTDTLREKWITDSVCEMTLQIREILDDDEYPIELPTPSVDTPIHVTKLYGNIISATLPPAPPPEGVVVHVTKLYGNVISSTAQEPMSPAPVYSEPFTVDRYVDPLTVDISITDPVRNTSSPGFGHPYLVCDQAKIDELADHIYNGGPAEYATLYNGIKAAVDADAVGGAQTPKYGTLAYGLVYQIELSRLNQGLPGASSKAFLDSEYANPIYDRLVSSLSVDWSEGDYKYDNTTNPPTLISATIDRAIAEWIQQMAIGYDLVYDYCRTTSASNHIAIRNKIAEETKRSYDAFSQVYNGWWDNWWTNSFYQNHMHRAGLMTLAYGGGVLRYEGSELTNGISQAQLDNWGDFLKKRMRQDLHAHKYNDGVWPEGRFYEQVGLYVDELQSTVAALSAYGIDAFTDRQLFRMNVIWNIYNSIPGEAPRLLDASGDSGNDFTRKNRHLALSRFCARYYRDEQAQWLADTHVSENSREIRIDGANSGMSSAHTICFELLLYDHTVPSTPPPSSWPNSIVMNNSGIVLSRNVGPEDRGSNHYLFTTKAVRYAEKNYIENLLTHGHYEFTGTNWKNPGFDNPTNPAGLETPVGGIPIDYPQNGKHDTGHQHPDRGSFSIVKNREYMAFDPGQKTTKTDYAGFGAFHNMITLDNDKGHMGEDDDGIELKPQSLSSNNSGLPNIGEFMNFQPVIDIFSPGQKSHDFTSLDLTSCWIASRQITKNIKNFFVVKDQSRPYTLVIEEWDSGLQHSYEVNFMSFGSPVRDSEWVQCNAGGGEAEVFGLLQPSAALTYSVAQRDETSAGEGVHSNFDNTVNRRLGQTEFYRAELKKTIAAGPHRIVQLYYHTSVANWTTERPTYSIVLDDGNVCHVELEHNVDNVGFKDWALLDCNFSGAPLTLERSSGTNHFRGKAVICRFNNSSTAKENLLTFQIAKGSYLRFGSQDIFTTTDPINQIFDSVEVDYNGQNALNATAVDVNIKTVQNFYSFKLYAPALAAGGLKMMDQVYNGWVRDADPDYIVVS